MPSAEEIAERRVPGAGAVHVEPLISGLVNESFRVLRDGRWFSLRMAAADNGYLGLDRQWECRVLKVASAAGLAPRIAYCDPTQGIVVAEWVAGNSLCVAEIDSAESIAAMAALLRAVHALPVPSPTRRMTPAAWLDSYASAARSAGAHTPRARSLQGAAKMRLDSSKEQTAAPVLCHGDVHRFNVVQGDSLLLLDWEYAHVAEPLWDLAGWAANNDWSGELPIRLLHAYLQRPASPPELERLGVLGWLYDYVCLLWSELYLSQGRGQGRDVEARADALAARLARVR